MTSPVERFSGREDFHVAVSSSHNHVSSVDLDNGLQVMLTSSMALFGALVTINCCLMEKNRVEILQNSPFVFHEKTPLRSDYLMSEFSFLSVLLQTN